MLSFEQEARESLGCMLEHIDFDLGKVSIYIDEPQRMDSPRIFYILYTLSRAHASNFLEIKKGKILHLLENLYVENRFVQVYALRALKLLGEEGSPLFKKILSQLLQGTYEEVYSERVLRYIFVSMSLEIPELFSEHRFLDSVLNECKKTFIYLLHSSRQERLASFAFSEIIHWEKILGREHVDSAKKIIDAKILAELKDEKMHSSGLAKTGEHYGACGNLEMVMKILGKVKKREMQEGHRLDTKAHILNSYLNFLQYEKDI